MTRDPDGTRTHHPAPANDPALDAGLAAAFGPATNGWTAPPLLRDDSSDGPVVQPASSEMPRTASDRYQLLGEIARGGMGVILKGRDPRLGRDMAFKVLKTEHIGKPAAEQRFVEEAQVGGQLQHPGILPVYDLGRFDDGRPFFAMKFVKGDTLADQLAERASPSADRGHFLQIFLKVCETVAYAHSRGVIHRDIKPSNIMVANYGEVLVMDWGLAKVLPRGGVADEIKATQMTREPEPPRYEPTVIHTARVGSIGSETLSGSVMGTPAFMPPEQAGGEIDKLDERADVFGLGAVLCVILTSKPPYVAGDSEAVRLMAVRGKLDEAFARLDASGSDADLIALCKRCLSAEPADRPRHAGEVKEAVAAYLAGVEDRAHRAEVERAAAEVKAAEQRKRRRVQAILGMTVTAALLVGGGGLWWADRQAADRRREHDVAQARDREAVAAALDRAESALRADKLPEADAALAQAAARLDEAAPADLRGRYEELKRDRDVVRELDDIAERRWTVWGEGGRLAGTDPKIGQWFDQAFGCYGLAVGEGDPAQVADRVRASRVSAALVAGLNEWFFLVPKQVGLQAVLDRADPNPALVDVRAAVAAGQADCVRDLAARVDGAKLTPGFAVALGMHSGLSNEEGYKLMRAAWDTHPDSFGLALRIGTRVGSIADAQPQHRERALEAVAWNRTAVALRPQSAVAHNNLGRVLEHLGELDMAEASYRRAIQLAPDMELPHANLVDLHAKKPGEQDAALVHARRLVERFPNSAHSHNALGRLLYMRKEHASAAAAFRDAIGRDALNPIYHANYGNALVGLKDYPAALASYRRAIELDEKYAPAHRALGKALIDRKDYLEAWASLCRATELEPNDVAAHNYLAVALIGLKDYPGAVAAWQQAIELEPKNWEAHSNLGIGLLKMQDYPAATAALRRAIELDPKRWEPYSNLGIALRELHNFPASEASLRRAIELDPKHVNAYMNLGRTVAADRGVDAAIATLREMAGADPKNSAPLVGLGRILVDQKDWDGAADAFRKAIGLNPEDAVAHNGLGAVLCDFKRDYDGAIRCFREAIRLDPNVALHHNNLGNALSKIGDLEEAIASHKEAIRLDPNSDRFHNNLAWLLATGPDGVRNGKQAVELATRACELSNWKNPGLIDTLAAAYGEAGDFDKAVEYAKKALNLPGIKKELEGELRERLAVFEQKRPYHEPTPARPELGPPPREVK